jgi:hypothetical protein
MGHSAALLAIQPTQQLRRNVEWDRRSNCGLHEPPTLSDGGNLDCHAPIIGTFRAT